MSYMISSLEMVESPKMWLNYDGSYHLRGPKRGVVEEDKMKALYDKVSKSTYNPEPVL